ncbi:hypothetical protein [Burkholderia gladioli]|uniref:hypothetical protein n=1 Tax=Burkholderia gladioli TaxID=28095 RepID=UPI001640C99F|nr:hypothetical protein [Burkholderia gladioli]
MRPSIPQPAPGRRSESSAPSNWIRVLRAARILLDVFGALFLFLLAKGIWDLYAIQAGETVCSVARCL